MFQRQQLRPRKRKKLGRSESDSRPPISKTILSPQALLPDAHQLPWSKQVSSDTAGSLSLFPEPPSPSLTFTEHLLQARPWAKQS